MLGGHKFWAVVLCTCFLFIAAMPAMAADPDPTPKDLKGISPQRYKYLFSVAGGAAVGAGIGFIVGSGNDITKGVMVGGGAMSFIYLHKHKNDNLHGWRNWAMIGGNTALVGGIGWTLCGCNDGLVAGSLIGGGVTAAWMVAHPQKTPTTAKNPNNP